MRVEGLRSPREKVGGLFHFGRMLDKIRLHQAGKLPAEYHPNLGLSIGLDGHCVGFLNIEFQALTELVQQGGSDEEILDWCYQHGHCPNKVQIRIWNEFARKFGWNDRASDFLAQVKKEDGFAERADIQTAFDLIDLREQRLPTATPSTEA